MPACTASQRIYPVRGKRGDWCRGQTFVPRTICQVCGTFFYAPPVQRRRGGGKFCSVQCRSKAFSENPDNYPQLRSKRGKGGRRQDLGGIYFRSSWEANWARYLNWLQSHGQIKSWKFEPDTYEFHGIKRGGRFYTPDFRVLNMDDSIEYHEVKGYMDQRSATKLKRMAKYYPKICVRLIAKAEYEEVRRKVSGLIDGWE